MERENISNIPSIVNIANIDFIENIETDLQEPGYPDPPTLLNRRRNSYNTLRPTKSRDMKRHVAQGKFIQLDNPEYCVQCHKVMNKARKNPSECLYHPKKWNGFNFECCDNRNKFNLGCKTGFHVSEEEENLKRLNEICTNCKVQGHDSKKCPLDPNARTGEDPIQELNRISSLRNVKASQKMVNFRKFKVKDNGFEDISMLKNSVCRERSYVARAEGTRGFAEKFGSSDVNETKDSSTQIFKKMKKIL